MSKKSDTALEGGADQRDRLHLVRGRAVAVAQPHASQAQSGHFQIAVAEFSLLHCFLHEEVSDEPTAETVLAIDGENLPSVKAID